MREIDVKQIRDEVARMCIETNYFIGEDIKSALEKSAQIETSPIGRAIVKDILTNSEIACSKEVPICQDTGLTVVFLEVGQGVSLVGGDLKEAVNEGIRRGYQSGYLRKSVVEDPLLRVNTKDNTPGVIYIDIVPGDQITIKLAPKGFGSENMSRTKMLKPSEGIEGVKAFILETVRLAGPNPCPPIVVGVGIGGTIDKATQLAKYALFRDIRSSSQRDHIKKLEEELLLEINALGIGPQGLGGDTTALGINIEVFPTHIAGLPVAVNINCHATRHQQVTL